MIRPIVPPKDLLGTALSSSYIFLLGPRSPLSVRQQHPPVGNNDRPPPFETVINFNSIAIAALIIATFEEDLEILSEIEFRKKIELIKCEKCFPVEIFTTRSRKGLRRLQHKRVFRHSRIDIHGSWRMS